MILCIVKSIKSANILYVIPLPIKSHYISLSPLGLELADRGHNVTVITMFKEIDPPPNYREIIVDGVSVLSLLGKF